MHTGEPQDSPFLRAIAKLAIRCSENFLLGFYEPYFHQQSLGTLTVVYEYAFD